MTKVPNLFKLMKERNITAKHLSQELNISQGNISDWKSGKSIPSIPKVKALAEYFGVTSDYLISCEESEIDFEKTNTQEKVAYDSTSTELISKFNNLSLCDKTKVLNLVIELEQQQIK